MQLLASDECLRRAGCPSSQSEAARDLKIAWKLLAHCVNAGTSLCILGLEPTGRAANAEIPGKLAG